MGVNLHYKHSGMEESKRQKQVARMLEEELNEIFRKKGWNIIGKGMVSISKVRITSDLSEAKIYISMFQIDDQEKMLQNMESNAWEVRKELGIRLKNTLRKVPSLAFYNDDTLEYVSSIEKVLKRLNIDKKEGEE